MQEFNLTSWDEFEERLKGLENEHRSQWSSSELLYRGQGRKKWELLTTLERYGKKNLSVMDYFRLISIVKPQIESFTGENRNIPSYPDGFEEWLNKNSCLYLPKAFGIDDDVMETYSYLVVLRHYGFPSPLLDWSSSPYIAAFFAFKDVQRCEEYVSFFVYFESKKEHGMKSIGGDNPWIYIFPPEVRTDRRHYNQQSRYSICVKKNNGAFSYEPHAKVFELNNKNQDVLWKFNIPYSERLKVLKQLDKYNINALSLFGSKESLMETMALREIHFK